MAGKVNGRKSKARVSDAIKLNGENDLETSTEEAAGDASISNIEPPVEEATPESGTSTKSPSTAKSPSPIKAAVRVSRGSKRKEEAISASEEDSDAAQTTVASEMAAPRRGSRPKKPKLDPDMVNVKWTLKTVIKEEPQEEEPPAAANTDGTESRPQSQQSFKSEDESSISVGSPASGKSRGKTDVSNPAYLKPMMHGWKRELVFRATADPNGRRQGDIYYYAPNGKKLRSGRELVNYLTDDLTLDNFTFAKEPLGINDPEKEIIRDAKGIKPRLSVDSPSGGMLTPPQTSNTPLGKRVRKPKLPKGASPTPTPPHATSETTTPVLTKTPTTTTKISPKKSFKVKLTNSRLSSPTVDIAGPSGVKSLPKSQNRKSLNTVGDKPSNSDLKSEKTPATKVNKRSNNKNSQLLPPTQLSDNGPVAIGYKPSITPMQEQCSIQCIKAMGMIPTLQCAQCLCLYHAECAGLYQSNSSYICLNCHAKNSEAKISTEPPSTSPLPPLTPITSIKTHTPVSATPPKLQRIPKAGEKIFIPPPKIIAQNKLQPGLKTSPNQTNNNVPVDINKNKKLVMVPRFVKVHQNDNATTHKSLVGSVTTWLPPSSTVQVNKAASQVEQKTSTAQDMAVIGGKKYIIVPKHNVLSVSPAQSCVEEGKNEKHDIIVEKRDITISDISQSTDTKVFDKPDIEINLVPDPVPILKATTLSVENITSVDRNLTLAADDESSTPSPKKKSVGKDKDVAADETSAVIAPAVVSAGPSVVQMVADGFTIAPNPFTQFFFTNISTGYYTLLQVFQYLKVQELLRASRVCRMWNELALDKSLWRTVRMKNSNIVNWTGFAKTLHKLGTKHLDLRKMLIASSEADEMWNKFSENIHMADSLTTIDICRCPARVLEQLFITNPGLTVINAVAIRDDRINIENITNLKNLQELRLKSTMGFVIEKDLSGLKELSGLKQLSITSVRDLGKIGCEVIGELTELRTLELGECTDFPESFGKDALSKLINLERLRLEKGQGNCCTFDILHTISQLPAITQLELLNFDIKAGFDKTLASCSNIRKLLIIPTYISQSATTNHMVLGGVINLSSSLTHFVWGVTLELLRVTELFVDQCEGSKKEKKPTSESIPVLKPVPGLKLEDASPGVYPSSNAEVPQVEIMPLPALQKLLTDTLPQTKIRILKIPFHSTWRQSISEFQ